jgi:hypothetical protein
MRFYTKQHKAYCGIDLHARSMYVCILNQDGEILLHRNMKTSPEIFLKAIAPYREDLVVAVACLFPWYWLADLCAQEGMPFVLGHALSMKAIHGGTAKNEGIRVKRDSRVSVVYAEGLNSAKSSAPLQSTDRHGILGQKHPDFQASL